MEHKNATLIGNGNGHGQCNSGLSFLAGKWWFPPSVDLSSPANVITHSSLRFTQPPGGQSNIDWLYSGLKWMKILQ